MPTPDVHAFVCASLPPRPARVLEIGAGDGTLAAALREDGYDVLAIDPAGGDEILQVPLHELDAPAHFFAAAVAVTSLHHVDPLDASIERLAAMLPAGAPLVVDEFDVGRYDERAARWWLSHSDAEHEHEPIELVGDVRAHLHPVTTITAALEPWFAVGAPVRGPYLYRWNIDPALRGQEEELIAAGKLPATGARFIATRGSRVPAATR
ncbi:MAG TPA: methyltransferase domain-containing protein [Solirubrobacteraceae bacterium]|jgi:SAM-dependent methyltransferase|nr:methyltransferase domain-containing protein [Solirubrobacteraceae bacterium]